MDIERIGTMACPASEDLAAFVDGRLPKKARAHLEHHLADCDICREIIADTVSLNAERLAGDSWTHAQRRAMTGAAAMVALAASLVVVVQMQPDLLPFGERHSYAELVAAVGQNRTVEGRLTGGFAYAPLKPATRAGRAASGDEDFRLLAANGELQQRSIAEPTAVNRHAAGVGQLVVGDFESAVTTLEAVVEQEPTNAAYYNDLAAAYLARGRQRDSREDFSRARSAAKRAISLDPSLDEGYFNYALAVDAMGQPREAEEAYRQALARDPQSPWNEEITMRLEQVRRP
jgi:tetratricopeptide (TPR) repeat protein